MAIRNVIKEGDPCLRKICREVTVFDDRLATLLDDMYETMLDANGVGLAAPQVGILKRVVVIDIGEGKFELINPVILKTEGSQTGPEGCLSLPGESWMVTRPNYVLCEAYDRGGEKYQIEGTELMARAICHELDHLDGVLYVDIAEEPCEDDEE